MSRRSHGPSEDDPTSQKEIERIRQFALLHLSDADSVPQEVVQAICDRHMVASAPDADDESSSPGLTLVESLSHQATAIPDCFQEEEVDGFPCIPSLSEEELKEKQRSDPALK